MDFLSIPAHSSRILVVDDDYMLNSLFCSFLNSKGFLTQAAGSLSEAIGVFERKELIDVVLLDYELGDGYGIELFTSPAFLDLEKRPPVIMVSANEDPVFLEQCFLDGVSDYIIKPVNLFLLKLKVQALLDAASLQALISHQNIKLEAFKQHAEREEAVAKLTYEYLLRRNSPVIPGIAIYLQSFSSFSGDIALAKRSPRGDLYFMLADATGHGLSAAITIMPVVTIFNTMVDKGFSLSLIVTEMNKKLVNDTPTDRFVAAILMEFNPVKNMLSVWNGAMPSACWVDENEIIHRFPSTTMALGILEDAIFDANVSTMELPKTGFLCAYSDGLYEQVNVEYQAFGVERVEQLLTSSAPNIIQLLIDELRCHANGMKYNDDVSICVLEAAKIFPWQSEAAATSIPNPADVNLEGGFEWYLRMSGDQLASCEIPVLCNQFLQGICFDQSLCQKVFAVISELISNGLDHGVLGLSAVIKEKPGGFVNYFDEKTKRLSELSERDYIELRIRWEVIEGVKRLIIDCRDSGAGYTPERLLNPSQSHFSGRGLTMIKKLSTSVEVIPPGNIVKVVL